MTVCYLVRISLFTIDHCLQCAVGVPFNEPVLKCQISIFLQVRGEIDVFELADYVAHLFDI